MRNIIFYWSGTGNGLALAKAIAKETGYELYPVAQAMREDFDYSSLHNVGIVTPVYAYGAPSIVEDFCKKITTANYIWTLANYGTSPGVALRRIRRIFKHNGLAVKARFYFHMPENFMPLFPSPDEKMLTTRLGNATEHLKKVIEVVKTEAICSERNPARWGLHGMVRGIGAWAFSFLDYGFRLNKDKCISCDLCSKVCPVKNITMVDGHPKWEHHCALCIACLQHCPKNAIDWGITTQWKKRYYHPDTKSAEFIQK